MVPVSIPDRLVHQGRAVVLRGDLMRLAGVPTATAENWYRDRAHNGHPRPVLAVGRRLYFDEEALLGWVETQTDPAPPPSRIFRGGRTLVTRAEIVRITGLSDAAVAGLYARRATTGHPEAVYRDRRHLYFDESDTLGWHAARTGARGAVGLDRGGDPDELVGRAEAARLLGYARPRVIDELRLHGPGYFPAPDATGPARWRRTTLWAFAARR